MPTPSGRGLRALIPLLLCWIACAASPSRAAEKRVLIFHKQNGFIHADTDSCVKILVAHLAANGLPAESTKDSLAFTPSNLARFGAVVFYNTNYRNGALLNRTQEQAFEGYIQNGGGFVGIHSAIPLNGAWEETVWPWYARLFGARFKTHPEMRSASMIIENTTHPSTLGLPSRITLRDEWYQTRINPRGQSDFHVLASLDASSYPGGVVTGDHPVSWHRMFESARTWVTLVGHDLSAFANADYLAHVRGGILWAGGWETTSTAISNPLHRTGAESRARAGRNGPPDLVYRGAGGGRLEIRNVAGKFIEARRFETKESGSRPTDPR